MTVDRPIYSTTTHASKWFAWFWSPRNAVLLPQASWKGQGREAGDPCASCRLSCLRHAWQTQRGAAPRAVGSAKGAVLPALLGAASCLPGTVLHKRRWAAWSCCSLA